MKRLLWTSLLALALIPQDLSAGCTANATQCSCPVIASCTGQTTCIDGGNYVECDGERVYCNQPRCSVSCPNPAASCSGCYCYYWQQLFGNTDVIACTDTYIPMGGSHGYPYSQACPGGDIIH